MPEQDSPNVTVAHIDTGNDTFDTNRLPMVHLMYKDNYSRHGYKTITDDFGFTGKMAKVSESVKVNSQIFGIRCVGHCPSQTRF